MNLKIKHIGIVFAVCSKKITVGSNSLREDLGYERYKQLGVNEQFAGEKPYRICTRCLKKIKQREKS